MNNDRFRFRAWDKENGKWIDPSMFAFVTFEGRLVIRGKAATWYKIMQCTGLKDSEGNLIWEGDIIKRFNEINPDYGFDICQINWNQARCYFELQGQKEYYGHICGNHANDGRYKVIGNIYENPELLKNPPPASREDENMV